jgi:hypothetical protein
MIESKDEYDQFSSEEFVQGVETFFAAASGWCNDHGLAVKTGVVKIREELIPEYGVPSLYLLKDGVSLARMIPVGSRILCARGRVDLIGQLGRHPLLFCAAKGPEYLTQTNVGGKTKRPSSRSLLSGVLEEGWYWIEGGICRPKRVDESLFLDLVTDVSDYEF